MTPAQEKPAARRSYIAYRTVAAGLVPEPMSEEDFAALRARFRFRISDHYLSKCRLAGAPLWRQVLPNVEELHTGAAEVLDPLDEDSLMPVPGLVHRYPSRVLWLISSVCSSYCRYCTRKRIVSHASQLSRPSSWEPVFEYIAQKTDLREVILSGGDPLRLGSSILARIVTRLSEIPHLKSIRFHSRELNFRPGRLDGDILDLPELFRPLYLVHHFNHPAELGSAEKAAARRLQSAGFIQLNQSVLLKGVNNNTQTLADLSYRLLEFGIQPYYLHFPDNIQGTRHFAMPLADAHRLIKNLQGHLPGPAVPELVVDRGRYGKIRISPNQPIPDNGVYEVETYGGYHLTLK